MSSNFFAEYADKQRDKSKVFSTVFVPSFAPHCSQSADQQEAKKPETLPLGPLGPMIPVGQAEGCEEEGYGPAGGEFYGYPDGNGDEEGAGYYDYYGQPDGEYYDDEESVSSDAGGAVHSGEYYETLAPAEEASVSKDCAVLDAIADWEENTPLDELPDSSTVCTFWVRGQCRVFNCKFLHQYYGVRCHHGSQCIKGDLCPFVHTTVADQRRRFESRGSNLIPPMFDLLSDDDKAALAAARNVRAPTEEEFPTLGSDSAPSPAARKETKKTKTVEYVDKGDWDDPELGADIHVETVAEKLSLLELKRSFDWVPPAVVETIFVQWFVIHHYVH